MLDGVLRVLIDVLLVVGDNRLGDGLTDGVDLGSVSTTSNPDADIDVGELVEADNEEGLVDLESQDLGLDEVERLAVHLDESFTSLILPVSILPSMCSYSSRSYLAVSDGRSYSISSAFCPPVHISRKRITCLLLAEALYTLR